LHRKFNAPQVMPLNQNVLDGKRTESRFYNDAPDSELLDRFGMMRRFDCPVAEYLEASRPVEAARTLNRACFGKTVNELG
jgi:hypothetical protein